MTIFKAVITCLMALLISMFMWFGVLKSKQRADTIGWTFATAIMIIATVLMWV